MTTPSTRTSSVSGFTRAPRTSTTVPFTSTRPCVMSVSHARRDATPAAASTFWRRSAMGDGLLELLRAVVEKWRDWRELLDAADAEMLEELVRRAPQDGAGLRILVDLGDEAAADKRSDDRV